jgi:hypothetical protein
MKPVWRIGISSWRPLTSFAVMTGGGARLQLNILEFRAVFYCLLRNSRLCTEAEARTTRGGQPLYSALAILTALTLRALFRLAYRTGLKLCGAGDRAMETSDRRRTPLTYRRMSVN